VVSKRFELSDEAFGEPIGVLADEIVAAEVAKQLAGSEHVPDGGEDRVPDRGDRLAVAAAAAEALVLGGEVAVFRSGGGVGRTR